MQIRFAAFLFICLFAGLFALTFSHSSFAATTLPTKMNFQGRVTNSSGNILANGTYNMKFKIWSAASGGTQQWSEDRLVSATQGVTVTNGQFSVQLGSVTSLPASVFTSNSLYFEVELPTPASATTSSPVWTEGAMTPRNQLATSAYAYNSETLDGLDSAAFGQLDQNNAFTGNNTFDGTLQGDSSLTLGTISGQGSLVLHDGSGQTGTLAMANTAGNYTYSIPVTTANDTFCLATLANCASSGISTVGALDGGTANADGATISGDTVYLQSASATDAGLINTTTQTFAGNKTFNGTLTVVNSANFSGQLTIGTSDTTGTLLVLDTKTDAGDPAGTNGAMYYNSNLSKFRCYEAGAWRNCANSAAMSATTVPGAWGVTVAKSAAATILVSPVYIPGPMTVNTMRIRVTTALGAAGDVGLYNSAGTLMLNGGSSSLTTTTGIKSIAPTQTGTARIMQPGQYFVAITWNSTTGVVAGANLGLAGTMAYTGTLASGGGLVLPSSITPASITETTYLYGVSLNQ